MSVNPNTPVLVGAAQYVGRADDPADGLSPQDMLAEVARTAIADSGADVAGAIDTLAAVRLFADSSADAFASPFGSAKNLPWSVAQRIGAGPKHLIYGPVGGNSPQLLVNDFAERIYRGEAEVCLIAGGEALRTQARAAKAGLKLDWAEDAPSAPQEPFSVPPMLTGHEAKHGVMLPVNIYPMFETAFGAAAGWSLDEHLAEIGRLMAPFSKVASENPYAQVQTARSPEELTTATADNRWISWPYTKYLVSNLFVDQAGAVLLMSSAKADELGIAKDARVYLHGSADTNEKILPVERPDYARCPAIEVGAAHALAQAGVTPDELDVIDLYSCFPVAVQMAAKEIGLSTDDPARLTQTGGLPYFGGAGNAYSMHGIAEVFAKCRAAPEDWGFVFANGGYLTKHSFGVYSGRPGYGERVDPATYQRRIDEMPSPELEKEPTGEGVIEAYTVMFDRSGPTVAPVIARQGDKRFLAQIKDGLDTLMTENAVGRRVTVDSSGPVNVARLV
ncbi:MAG: acetyl-CoA acetyltransferase [Pacificimonas sp.]|jgi:acetyl-CoA C-acetyltransferase|nr:acetyl-CoA acetyltransferase [Pacificimonas sp.]